MASNGYHRPFTPPVRFSGGAPSLPGADTRPARCPDGEHDFGSGTSPCTKCRRTMKDLGVEHGFELNPVDVTPRAIPITGVAEPMEPSPFRGLAEMIDSGFFDRPLAAPKQALVDHQHVGDDVPANVAAARNDVAVLFDAQSAAIEGVVMIEHAWNRADEIAKAYGIARREGEDDDSLHARVRRYVASHPGSFKSPPPMGWTPNAPALETRAVDDEPNMKRVN